MEKHLTHLTHQELNNARPADLKWFAIDEWSPGSPIFLPPGMFIYQKLMEYLRKQYKIHGYQEVITPNIWKNWLWKTSGHSDKYAENMFTIGGTESGEEKYKVEESYALKPMNCGGHYRIFGQHPRHYNELPLRIAEFGTLHRNEIVGALRGLVRVRKFCQDDSHIFCTNNVDQIVSEITSFLELLHQTYTLFGFTYTFELSTKPVNALEATHLEQVSIWDKAETILAKALSEIGAKWKMNAADGAFYGPKIDVHLTDSIGRSHQCGTIQLDYQLPERFNVWYYDENGKQQRPVVLHRAIFGSLERFIGILLEHYQGELPLWLSSKQFLVCSLYKKGQDQTAVNEYCELVKRRLLQARWQMEVDIDTSSTHIKAKVKTASERGYHYILVIGDKEVDNQTVSIRKGREFEFGKTLDNVIEIYDQETNNKNI
jgi:threonyl-tRNA synthetase